MAVLKTPSILAEKGICYMTRDTITALPERAVMTGIGPVSMKVPRVRGRGQRAETLRFTSSILPPYLRKAKSV